MIEVKYGTTAVQSYKHSYCTRTSRPKFRTVQYGTGTRNLVNVHNGTVLVRTYIWFATHRVPRRATIDENGVRVQSGGVRVAHRYMTDRGGLRARMRFSFERFLLPKGSQFALLFACALF